MLQISVNGLTRDLGSRPENWGDLLNSLENGDGSERQVVTAVRFDGVAVPTFREAETLGRSLVELGPIDIRTATVDELLHESAQAACDSIAPLKSAAQRIALRLRSGHELAAARDLPELTSSIQTLTTLTAALARAKACVPPHRADFDALVLRCCRLVDGVITRQVRGDWKGVADLIELDLVPTLDAWHLVARRVWRMA